MPRLSLLEHCSRISIVAWENIFLQKIKEVRGVLRRIWCASWLHFWPHSNQCKGFVFKNAQEIRIPWPKFFYAYSCIFPTSEKMIFIYTSTTKLRLSIEFPNIHALIKCLFYFYVYTLGKKSKVGHFSDMNFFPRWKYLHVSM